MRKTILKYGCGSAHAGPEETRLIREYFSDHIATYDTASLTECMRFLKIYPMDRSVKNIQDKVKSLVHSAKVAE